MFNVLFSSLKVKSKMFKSQSLTIIMVVDTLDNLEKYVSLNPLFADVVKFIKDNDLSKLEDGKHFYQGG